VYFIGSPRTVLEEERSDGKGLSLKNQDFFSAEFCGGPHVNNTSELGHFKILKEEASSAGVRRIKAILE
jgi:alanyl-tRNA synthetase